jgi:hypothetical protein
MLHFIHINDTMTAPLLMGLAKWLLSSLFGGWVYQRAESLLEKDRFYSLTQKALAETIKDERNLIVWNTILEKEDLKIKDPLTLDFDQICASFSGRNKEECQNFLRNLQEEYLRQLYELGEKNPVMKFLISETSQLDGFGSRLERLEQIYPQILEIFETHINRKTTLFLSYEDLFKEELNGRSPVDHRTALYDRGNEKDCFLEFLESQEKILMVYGQGGIGKTRILIEFARIAERQKWTQIFIRVEEEAFDEHLVELLPDERYIIFLDNAHRYDNFEKLLEFIVSEKPEKVKLVFSTRPVFHNNFKNEILIRQFPPDFREIEIPKLENANILQLLEELRIVGDEKEIICRISEGFPLITILAVQFMREGGSLKEISYSKAIQSFFGKYIDELRKNKGPHYVDLLKYLAFLIPMPMKNKKIHSQLGELLNVSEIKEQMMIQDLLKERFIERRAGKLKIVPELMGEYLIHEACYREDGTTTGVHQPIIERFIRLVPKQLITNLALAEMPTGNKSLLNEFLEDLKERALMGDNLTKFTILEWLKDLVYLRPEDTLDIIRNMLKKEQGASEYVHQFWGKMTIDHSDIRENIPELLKGVANFPYTFEETIEILKNLALEEGDVKRSGRSSQEVLLDVCSTKNYRDIRISGNRCETTTYFKEQILKKIELWSFKKEALDYLILEIVENQLWETIDVLKKSLEEKGKITLYEYTIPEDSNLQEIRPRFFKVLFGIGSDSPWVGVRARASDLILDIWSRMIRKEKKERDGEKERKMPIVREKKRRIEREKDSMLCFLDNRMKEEENWRVIDGICNTLKYLERWEKKGTQIQKRIEQIACQMDHDDEFQFYRLLVGHKEIKELRDKNLLNKKIEYFSRTFIPERLVTLLNQVLRESKAAAPLNSIKQFLHELGIQFPDYALHIFELLQETESQARMYSGYVLSGLRISKPKLATFIVENLKVERDMEVIVNSYELMISHQNLDESDLDLLEELLETDDKTLKIKICSILPNFQHIDTRKCLKILEYASFQATSQLAETILLSLLRFKSSESNIQIYKSIIMNFLPLENIFGFEFGFIMNEVVGYDPIFLVEFLEKRIEYKETIGKNKERYRVIPFSFDAIESFDEEEQHLKSILRRIRDWLEKGDIYATEAPFVFWEICSIQGGQTREETASAVKEVLQEWIEEGSHVRLDDVANLLTYSPLTEWVFELLEEIIEKSDGDQGILSSVSAAISTTSEAEMVSFGEISPQTLRQIELLRDMKKRSRNRHVKRFAEDKIREIKESAQWMREISEEEW